MDLDQRAIEAEADRLCGVYLQVKVKVMAQAQRIEILQAGREAVAKGLISADERDVVREAVGGR